MDKQQKIIVILIWTAIIASAMSLFGFVYEGIDFIPNYFGTSPIEAKMQWNNFHSITNPAYYHIPPSAIAIVAIIMIWFYRRHLLTQNIRKLKTVSILIVLINILTGIAVTQINDKLYFEMPIEHSETVKNLAITWAILNFIRLVLTALCTITLVKMFSIKLKKPNGSTIGLSTF